MRIIMGSLVLLASASACTSGGGDGASYPSPYPLGQALVIGESGENDDGDGQLVTVDASCDTEACAAVRERCGDQAYAEVVVGSQGQVLDVVCFRGNARFEELGRDPVETASAGNNTVLVLDGVDDGDDVTGDVVLAGNNAVLYGQGADVSRVGGAMRIDKNNAVVRGVRIGGDVLIDKNNAQLSFVEILGDLTISGNNTTLAGSTVHGRVVIEGVNTVLVQNRFFGAESLAGKNLECNGNVAVSAAEEPPAAHTVAGAAAEAGDAGAADEASDASAETPLVCQDVQGSPRGRP